MKVKTVNCKILNPICNKNKDGINNIYKFVRRFIHIYEELIPLMSFKYPKMKLYCQKNEDKIGKTSEYNIKVIIFFDLKLIWVC